MYINYYCFKSFSRSFCISNAIDVIDFVLFTDSATVFDNIVLRDCCAGRGGGATVAEDACVSGGVDVV